jgi:hypothetical protein
MDWRVFGAMKAGYLQAGVDLCQLCGTAYLGFDLKTTPPPNIAPKGEPA